MAKNYNKMAIDIVREIGGEENVKSLAHCMTRLRFIVKDEKKVNLEALKKAEGVIQVMTPLALSFPGHNLLTEDKGVLLGVDDCPCGRKGKYFKLTGRMQRAEIRGCSDVYADETDIGKS